MKIIEIDFDWLVQRATELEAGIATSSKWSIFKSKEKLKEIAEENAISLGKMRMISEILQKNKNDKDNKVLQ